MSARQDLQDSLTRLLQALGDYDDPMQPQEIVQRWAGVSFRAGSIARNSGAWNRLGEEPAGAGPVLSGLDGAYQGIVGADYGQQASVEAALGRAETAVGGLEALLGV
jgi:hypothetical protein